MLAGMILFTTSESLLGNRCMVYSKLVATLLILISSLTGVAVGKAAKGVKSVPVIKSPLSLEQAESEGCYILKSNSLAVAVSSQTGAVAGIWDLRLQNKLVIRNTNDEYRIADENGTEKTSESNDKVISVRQNGKKIIVKCRNEILDRVEITKTYRFANSAQELSRRVEFHNIGSKGYFIEYFHRAELDSVFAQSGHFNLHADDYLGPGDMTFDSRKYKRIVAQYRYRINDKYVMVRSGFNFSNEYRYGKSGWFAPVFADYLQTGSKSSAEIRVLVLAGDEFDYYSYYDNLPEVRKVYDIDVSRWFWKKCRMDAMYMGRNLPLLAKLRETPCMTTRWNLNLLWGDYFSQGKLVCGTPKKPRPTVLAKDIARENYDFIKSAPHWRISMYTWLWSIARETRTLKEHPEFVVTTRKGKFDYSGWRHDLTGERSYLKEIRAAGFMEYFLNQYRQYAQKMGVQFVYIDGCPSGISRLDWRLKTVEQNYDWLEYFRKVRQTIRSVKPDGFLFVNNPNQPYSDGGYYEDHSMIKKMKKDWRAYAHRLMVLKYRERPKRWHALLYWTEASKPVYSDYTLGLGFTYSNGGTEWHAIKLKAYVDAAWELRGSKMVMAVESPCFLRGTTNFEVYSLRKGCEGLVSIINRGNKDATVPVRLNAEKMGFNPEKPVYVWQLRMRDTRGAKKWTRIPTQCFDKRYLGKEEIHNGKLNLRIKARPLLLELIVLTQSPLWLTEVNGEELRTVQNNILTASIVPVPAEVNRFRVAVEGREAKLFLISGDSGCPVVRLDGRGCKSVPAKLGNIRGYSIQVARGRHILSVK